MGRNSSITSFVRSCSSWSLFDPANLFCCKIAEPPTFPPPHGITVIPFLHHRSHYAEQGPLLPLSLGRLLPFLGMHNLVDRPGPGSGSGTHSMVPCLIHAAPNQIEGKEKVCMCIALPDRRGNGTASAPKTFRINAEVILLRL
jgi:hypothetical protein